MWVVVRLLLKETPLPPGVGGSEAKKKFVCPKSASNFRPL